MKTPYTVRDGWTASIVARCETLDHARDVAAAMHIAYGRDRVFIVEEASTATYTGRELYRYEGREGRWGIRTGNPSAIHAAHRRAEQERGLRLLREAEAYAAVLGRCEPHVTF